MPKETYFDKMEKEEQCKCKEPKGDKICLICGGELPFIEEEPEYGVFYGDKLKPKVRKEKKAVCDHILYEKDIVCWLGMAGIGKSILTKHFAFCLTSGTPFLEAYPISRPQRVALIQLEGEREETWERAEQMEKAISFDCNNFIHIFLPGLALDTESGLNEALEALNSPIKSGFIKNYDVIIFDPLYMTIEGDIKQAHVATAWCNNLRIIKGEFNGCSILVVGHPNKDQYFNGEVIVKKDHPIPGAKEFNNFFNSIYHFKEDKSKKLHYLEKCKDRSGKCVEKLTLRMIEPSPLYFTTMDEDGTDKHSVAIQVLTTYIRERDNVTRKELLTNFGNIYSESTISRATKQMKDNGNLLAYKQDGQYWYKWI